MTTIFRIILFITIFIPQIMFGGNDYYWSNMKKIQVINDKASLVLIYKESKTHNNIESEHTKRDNVLDVTVSLDRKITIITFSQD